MKVHVKAKIVEITEWSRDRQRIDGDISHVGESSVLHALAEQVKERLEDCDYKPLGLPFEQEFDIEPDNEDYLTEAEVKDWMLNAYIDAHYQYDYVVPTDCEVEWNHEEVNGV